MFWAISFLTFAFSEGSERALLSLTQWNLLAVPLVSAIGAANSIYARRRFDEFLLTQPVTRTTVFASSVMALLSALVGAFACPVALLCFLAGAPVGLSAKLIGATSALAAVSVLLGVWVGFAVEDRARGLGALLLVWLAASVFFDAFLLYLIVALEEYPIESMLAAAVTLNPVDAVRLLLYQDLGLRFLLPVTLSVTAVWVSLAGWTLVLGAAAWRVALRKDY